MGSNMATHVFFLIRTSLKDCKKKMKKRAKKKAAARLQLQAEKDIEGAELEKS